MSENNIAENAIAEQTSDGEGIAKSEETAHTDGTVPAKKSRKGLRAFFIILAVILVLGIGAGAFLLGRNTDFEPFSFMSCSGADRNESAEPPSFIGIWSNDDYTVSVSAGGILDINGTAYSYTTEGKIIVIRDSSGREHRIGFRKASNSLFLWLEGEKDDSERLRKETKNSPDKLYGTWCLGDAEVTFREDGTAEIYGKEYTFSADSFEITCFSDAGTEYMFYDTDKDYLTLYLPSDTKRTLRFVSSDSLVPELTGVWVEEKGADYMLFFDDSSASLGFFSGDTLEDYLYELYGEYSLFVEGDSLVFDVEDYKLRCHMKLDGDTMKVDILGESFTYCKVSDDPHISYDEIVRLWSMYSPAEAA